MLTIMMKEQHAPCSLCLALELQSFEVAWGPAWRALPWCRIYPISIREEHFTERRLQSKTAGIEICTDCMNLQLGRSHARNFMVIRKKNDKVTCFIIFFKSRSLSRFVDWVSEPVLSFICSTDTTSTRIYPDECGSSWKDGQTLHSPQRAS